MDPRRPARVTTKLSGTAKGRVLTAAAMDAHNTFARPQAVSPSPYAQGLVLELPPKSIVVVEVDKA